MGMVKLSTPQGFAADTAGVICLMLATFTGIPVSTTHTKTTAIMGVGAAKRMSSVNWSIVKEMAYAWILTFPGCGLLGFVMSYIFMQIF
jgi:PiT family inorganic phosphate transporter